jgi:alginate O-acetyltransferase complex protein AlgI
MVFSSLLFLYFFLPVLLIIYYVYKNTTYRNWVLIVFSFLFYSWGEPVWVLLLIVSAFAGYTMALLIERYRGTPTSKVLFVIAIILNIAILGSFKYAAFVVDNLNLLLPVHLPIPNIALPIGISFFTFEIICYLTDVYKGQLQAPRSPRQMLLYVSFFPHLIAGPIIRFTDIAHQMENRSVTLAGFSEGIHRFAIGLGKKVILANLIGENVPNLLGIEGGASSVSGAWLGIIFFTFQIYFDFSGYSDMAIGLGKMFGFTLKENFNYPYTAKSAGDFWRRWNISLGGFFRDYVYIPLGGNHKRYARNLFVVWFLTGLWHGASWNFIVWGLYFGLLIWLERLFIQRWLTALPAVFSHLYLIVIMIVGWVWFYFTDLNQAWLTLLTMFGWNAKPWITTEVELFFYDHIWILLIAAIASTPLPVYAVKKLGVRPFIQKLQEFGIGAPLYHLLLLIITTILLVGSTYNPFLYFRF